MIREQHGTDRDQDRTAVAGRARRRRRMVLAFLDAIERIGFLDGQLRRAPRGAMKSAFSPSFRLLRATAI